MTGLEATRLLLFSGAASILFSSLLGLAMLIPMQSWGQKLLKGINYKQIGAAHLDWIMLGLMQGLAAGIIAAFAIAPSSTAVWVMIFGGWANPLPYIFRSFGINAFAFEGGVMQRTASGLGLISSLAIVYAWFSILGACWQQWS